MDEFTEARCNRCGSCCREKLQLENGERIILDIFCPAYDQATKLCLIYEWRHTKEAWHLRGDRACLPVWMGMKLGEHPSDCAYAEPGYCGARFDPMRLHLVPKEDYDKILNEKNELRKKIMEAIDERKSVEGSEAPSTSAVDGCLCVEQGPDE